MNTSAFATAIRIKIEENQYKTYFFLFAFCLLITAFTVEKFVGNILSEQLEKERKQDFHKGIESALKERWNLHLTQIRSYAYWPDIWELVQSKKLDKAYLSFQLDPSLEKQFDFFAIYLSPDKPFITKWSDGSGNKIIPNNKIISNLYEIQNHKEGHTNHLIYFNQHFYLVSTTSLADNSGQPMIDGIMIFGYELDHFIQTAISIFPIKMDAWEGDEIPLNIYDSISLANLSLPESPKITLVYSPLVSRMETIRPYIIIMLSILSFVSLGLFTWILYIISQK